MNALRRLRSGCGTEVRAALGALRSFGWAIAACALLGAGVACLIVLSERSLYREVATAEIRAAGVGRVSDPDGVVLRSKPPRVRFEPVADRTTDQVGGVPDRTLLNLLDVDAIRPGLETELRVGSVIVSVASSEPHLPGRLANAFAINYAKVWRRAALRQVSHARSRVREAIESSAAAEREVADAPKPLTAQVRKLRALRRLHDRRVSLLQPAPVRGAPLFSPPVSNAILGALLGALLAIGVRLVWLPWGPHPGWWRAVAAREARDR